MLLGIGLGWGLVGMWMAMCVDEWLRAGFLHCHVRTRRLEAAGAQAPSKGEAVEHAGPPSGASGADRLQRGWRARVCVLPKKPELPPTEPNVRPFRADSG